MNLESRLGRLEQRVGAIEDCPLCAARGAKVHERDDGLIVVESWTVQAECPGCARPFDVQVVRVKRAAEN